MFCFYCGKWFNELESANYACPSCNLVNIQPFLPIKEDVAEYRKKVDNNLNTLGEMFPMDEHDRLEALGKWPPGEWGVAGDKTKEFKHTARIERVDNGFVCTTYVPEEDDVYTIHKDVFEDDDDLEVTSFIKLVRHLTEYYGLIGSKHAKERFWVGLVTRSGKPIREKL